MEMAKGLLLPNVLYVFPAKLTMWVVLLVFIGLKLVEGTTKASVGFVAAGFGRPCVSTSWSFELTIVAVDDDGTFWGLGGGGGGGGGNEGPRKKQQC